MASLLEVGTGFHPELTGRENIFFNGSLLGMKRKEIEAKFDEIVDFSGVEKFLDTPLKHYSSGMQLRLAFSVAAFLEPEILVIDEVLAVGDAEFQKKCLGKMEDVSKSGRTILFVSHQLGILGSLCKRALILEKGKVIKVGDSHEIISHYNHSLSHTNMYTTGQIDSHKAFAITSVWTTNLAEELASSFAHDEGIKVHLAFLATQNLRNTNLCISINNRHGQRVFSSDRPIQNYMIGKKDINEVTVTIPKETLTPGDYSFFASIHCPNVVGYDIKDHICPISIYDNGSELIQYENRWFYGDVFVRCDWEFKFKEYAPK
jgi:lipopolysaccharide transport system ATP-binding protein